MMTVIDATFRLAPFMLLWSMSLLILDVMHTTLVRRREENRSISEGRTSVVNRVLDGVIAAMHTVLVVLYLPFDGVVLAIAFCEEYHESRRPDREWDRIFGRPDVFRSLTGLSAVPATEFSCPAQRV